MLVGPAQSRDMVGAKLHSLGATHLCSQYDTSCFVEHVVDNCRARMPVWSDRLASIAGQTVGLKWIDLTLSGPDGVGRARTGVQPIVQQECQR